MTAYNRSGYIGEAIQSVLASSYANFELIITDDRSTDDTLAIAKEYEKNDPRVKVFSNEINLRDYPNRNRAASYAKGKYIKYLDSDDTIYPGGLEYCVTAMEKFPEAGMGILSFQKEQTGEEPVCWKPGRVIQHQFFVRGCLNIGPSGCIYRRDVFDALGGFDTRFGVASDNFFNILLASKYPVVLLPKVFFYYRVHEGQEQANKWGYLKNNHLYMRELVHKVVLPLSTNEIEMLKARVNKSFAKQLMRHFFQTRKISPVLRLMKETNYSLKDLVKGLLL